MRHHGGYLNKTRQGWLQSYTGLTLSEARILKEAMTCSAVSVSAVSRVMKSIKAWKVTTPVLLASTRVMMRANSTSPC